MNARRAWNFSDGVWLAGLSAFAVLAAWPIWVDIATIAIRNEEQSHILLTPLIVCWLAWVRRTRLMHTRPERSFLGAGLVIAGWLLAWFGFVRGIDIGRHFGAVLILLGAWLSVVGPGVFRAFSPAVFAVIFVLPVPGRVRQPVALRLQEVSAAVSEWFLALAGVPIERAQNLLTVNGVDVAVAEACNGMRMISALGLVTYAFVFSFPMRNGVRLFILALSPLIALIVNVVRLIPTVLMYGYADFEIAELFHDTSGWVMLFVGLGLLYSMMWLMRWLQFPIAPRHALTGA